MARQTSRCLMLVEKLVGKVSMSLVGMILENPVAVCVSKALCISVPSSD